MWCILDYVDKLTVLEDNPTWIKAVCPICGEPNLKINKGLNYGAYSCYANNCHTNGKLRNFLSPNTVFKSTVFNAVTPFKLTSLKRLIKPKVDVELASKCYRISNMPDVPVPWKTGNKTIYPYPEFNWIRVDTGNKKYFYPEPDVKGLPIYRPEYIQPCVMYVEGEKCASVCHEHNYAALTLANSLDAYKALVSTFDVIENLLIFTDNDKVGYNKAYKIAELAWQFNVNANIINPAKALDIDIDGYDIADALISGYSMDSILKNNYLLCP